MQSNIYAQKENGDLRLIAEIEGLSDPALAVDALLDEMPRLKQRQFIVIDLDNVMVVEAGDEIVQPRREINVSSSNGAVVAAEPDEDEDEEEPDEDEEEAEVEEEPAPPRSKARQAAGGGHKPGAGKPASRRKPAGKPTQAKPRSRSRAKSTAKSGGKSPFKANPASAE
jgi:hypothetical protein